MQGLQLHPEWLGKSVDVLGLYATLQGGNPDALLPVVPSLRLQQPTTLRHLTSLSSRELTQVSPSYMKHPAFPTLPCKHVRAEKEGGEPG